MTLDSFGYPHATVVKNLKDYLTLEGQAKRSINVKPPPRGVTAKGIPTQQNYSDCGLYLLGYIRKFFEDPESFVRKIMMKEFDMEKDWGHLSPSSMRHEIRKLLQDLYHKGQGSDSKQGPTDVSATKKEHRPTAAIKTPPAVEKVAQVHSIEQSAKKTKLPTSKTGLVSGTPKLQETKRLAKSRTSSRQTVTREAVDLTSEPEIEDSSDGTINADEMLDKGGDDAGINFSTGGAPLSQDWDEQLMNAAEAVESQPSRSPSVQHQTHPDLLNFRITVDLPPSPERPRTRGKRI